MIKDPFKLAAIVAVLITTGGSSAFANAVIYNPGWGCRTCGYSNGISISGSTQSTKLQVEAVKLPDGSQVVLPSNKE